VLTPGVKTVLFVRALSIQPGVKVVLFFSESVKTVSNGKKKNKTTPF